MTLHRTVREAIKTLIEDVPGTSNVWPYERFDKNRRDLIEFYMVGKKIHGWHIQRSGWQEKVAQEGVSHWLHQDWTIRHFQGLEDEEESELAFDDMLDAVADAFRKNRTLGGATSHSTHTDKHSLQLVESGPITLCGALCHGARLTLTTSNYIDLSEPYAGTAFIGGKYSIDPEVGPEHQEDYKDLTDGN